MLVLLLLSVSPIIIKAFMGDLTKDKVKKNTYLIICGLCIILVMGLRSRFSGTGDTDVYYSFFESVRNNAQTLSEQISKAIDGKSLLFSEVGFTIYVWLLAQVFTSGQWLLIISAIIMTVCTLRFISKYSEDIVLSTIMFLTLGLFTFNMNGLRQCLAMSICLFAYDFIKQKKFIPFVLIILLAMSFHKSTLIFGFSYFLIFMKPKWTYIIPFLTVLVLFVIFADNISFLYDSLTGEDYAGGESFESGGVVTIAIYLLIIGTAVVAFNGKWENNEAFLPLLLTIIGLTLYVIRYISVQIYERISYYFYYYSILLLPTVIKKFDKESKNAVNIIVYVLCLALFVYRLGKGVFANFQFII